MKPFLRPVVAVCITNDGPYGTMTFMEQRTDQDNEWGWPGGKMEKEEIDQKYTGGLRKAAAREMSEEQSVDISGSEMKLVHNAPSVLADGTCNHVYTIVSRGGEYSSIWPSSSIADPPTRWVTVGELRDSLNGIAGSLPLTRSTRLAASRR